MRILQNLNELRKWITTANILNKMCILTVWIKSNDVADGR